MKAGSLKVIFDTNVWISFLIGKRLSIIKDYISNGQIQIIITDQLLQEIRDVTARPKLEKYFPNQRVEELIELLHIIATNIHIKPAHFISKDPKDNFLLDLIHFSAADYLVTGDKDLLALHPFMTAAILTASEFEEVIKKM
jgi:uncharacterized protein